MTHMLHETRDTGNVPVGLKLQNREFLECSNCKAGLAEIVSVDPKATAIQIIVDASCPFCGDKSFKRTFSGFIRWSPFVVPDPNDAGKDKEILTKIVDELHDEDSEGNLTLHLVVRKHSETTKPKKVNKKEQELNWNEKR